jgi:crotonobetainyl-CoA:carnitine CoA-transferase CaiB-like acyl-CoA transferase
MTATGPLAGLRVIELGHERADWAGKLMADAGADVIRLEPPAGCHTRSYGPFLDDVPGRERSLYFWHYNTSKRGITLDVGQPRGRELFRQLAAKADFVLEGEDPGRMQALRLDYATLREANPRLIMASITPLGQQGDPGQQTTDLTLMARGGPAWSNGYDDHSLPPVRGGGNQAYHMGGHYAVMSSLAALLYRDLSGEGQHIDVNLLACANVNTEAATYTWLVAQQTVQRMTGRHANVNLSMKTQMLCKDGRYVNTGLPPRRGPDFQRMIEWLVDLGIADDFALMPVLELGAAKPRLDLARIGEDDEVRTIFGAGREALEHIAANVGAYEFFHSGQSRGFQVGIIYSPEEVFDDPQMQARGFGVELEHPELGRSYTYPGAQWRFTKSPVGPRSRAPLLGEHNAEVYGELGVTPEALADLRAAALV